MVSGKKAQLLIKEANRRLDHTFKSDFLRRETIEGEAICASHKKTSSQAKSPPPRRRRARTLKQPSSRVARRTGPRPTQCRRQERRSTIRIRCELPAEEEYLFALYRQVECYHVLHVHPQANKELLPENKALLDEIVKVWAVLIGKDLETLGFEKSSFALDTIHPENGRLFSKIVSVQRPTDPSKGFKEPPALGS